mgnify:CR=1 FL=1
MTMIIDKKMSLIERYIRFFHHEYLDIKEKFGPKLHSGLRCECLHEVGIVVVMGMTI